MQRPLKKDHAEKGLLNSAWETKYKKALHRISKHCGFTPTNPPEYLGHLKPTHKRCRLLKQGGNVAQAAGS